MMGGAGLRRARSRLFKPDGSNFALRCGVDQENRIDLGHTIDQFRRELVTDLENDLTNACQMRSQRFYHCGTNTVVFAKRVAVTMDKERTLN